MAGMALKCKVRRQAVCLLFVGGARLLGLDCWTPKIKALYLFETSGTIHEMAQRNSQEEWSSEPTFHNLSSAQHFDMTKCANERTLVTVQC